MVIRSLCSFLLSRVNKPHLPLSLLITIPVSFWAPFMTIPVSFCCAPFMTILVSFCQAPFLTIPVSLSRAFSTMPVSPWSASGPWMPSHRWPQDGADPFPGPAACCHSVWLVFMAARTSRWLLSNLSTRRPELPEQLGHAGPS